MSFVPLSDATGTSQLVCDFKVLILSSLLLVAWKAGPKPGYQKQKCPNGLPHLVCECAKKFYELFLGMEGCGGVIESRDSGEGRRDCTSTSR